MKKSFRGGQGKGSKDEKGGRGKQKRDIKNARSLSDVIGGKSGGKSGSDNQRSRAYGGPSERPTAQRATGGGSQTKGPMSNKLTYIMTFNPPGGSSPQSQEAPASRKNPSTPPASKPDPISARSDRKSSTPSPAAKAPVRKADYSWPQERVTKKPQSPKPGQKTRGGSEGGRAGGRRGHSVPVVQGIVKRHPDGFGFLIPDDSSQPDVYIARQSMTGVMTNDRVEAEVYQSRKDEDRWFGEITKVISRANGRVVGKYLPVDRKYGVILDDGKGWGADLRIPAEDSMDAKEGDMVAAEITQYPDDGQEFTGRVVALIGDVDDPINDVTRVIYAQGIPNEFSAEALADARSYGGEVKQSEIKEREDIRDRDLITIDGATARDFDDAIYVESTSKGFKLTVAIADVSHYVKPGTKLDEEAYERGTSTYFPNFVVPMLPEELSNELCSLKPHVPRLCFACEMDIDFEGVVTNYRFFEAVMESKARVIYGEAQEVIDGKTPQKLKHVEENILRAADLARILMNKRFREGSLDLEIPETQVVVDPSGETSDIIRANRLFAHRLIEELMLVTNICTAKFMDEAGIPGIYRIHEEPKEENIEALQRYLWNFGGSSSVMGSSNLQKKITKALQSVEGKPGAQVINMLTLRAMNQAMYSNENVGHFGLGFSHYSHFTSPIRRYPDLIAHRLIKSQIYPEKYMSMQMSEEELASASTALSGCEQRSVKAERQVISIKKARFMKKFVGQEFEGLISSVTKFGVFVLLRQYDVDGLVKIEELGNDKFIFDDENLRLMGKRSGVRYSIGDRIRVLITESDPMQGRIDMTLAEEQPEQEYDENEREARIDASGGGNIKGKPRGARKADKAGKKKRVDVQKRGKAKNDSRSVRKKRVSRRSRKD